MKVATNIILSCAVLAGVIWWADAGVVLEHLRGASVLWLLLAGTSLTALTFLMAKRWQIVAAAVNVEISYPRAVGEYYIAQLVNQVVPGGVVGDVSRAVRVRHAGDLVRAAQSVAADRIIGQVMMFAVLGVGLGWAVVSPNGIEWMDRSWMAWGSGAVIVVTAWYVSRQTGATGRFLRLIFELLRDPRLFVLAVVITALLLFSLYACARATGTIIPVQGWFTLIPLVLSAMLIPLSVAGWGWREGAAAALFPVMGAAPSAGIAMGIAYGAMMLVAALPGIYFLVRSSVPPPVLSNTHMET